MTKPAAGLSSVRLKGLSSFTGTEASSNEVLMSVGGRDDQENKDPTQHMLNATADVHLLVCVTQMIFCCSCNSVGYYFVPFVCILTV